MPVRNACNPPGCMREVTEAGWHISGRYVHMLNACGDLTYLDGTIYFSRHFSVALYVCYALLGYPSSLLKLFVCSTDVVA